MQTTIDTKQENSEDESSLAEILGGPTKIKSKTTSTPIKLDPPKLELPNVGVLYQANKKKFLVIQYLEELETAENEAKRLKAEVVVPS